MAVSNPKIRPPIAATRVTERTYQAGFLHALNSLSGLEHGDDVRDGDVGLDVVDGVEDEPAVPAEDLAALEDLGPDLLGRPEGQGLLGVDAAAPEDDVPAELLL